MFKFGSICLIGLALAGETPKELSAPGGQQVLVRLKGKGDQVCVCQSSGAGYVWVFKAPDAKLLGEGGEVVGRHFAGPTWEANDGSRVTGRVTASVPSPDAGSIPWLLLTATSNAGSGIFTKVESIQRLATKGGKAAGEVCDVSREKREWAVPYEAEYVFYGGR